MITTIYGDMDEALLVKSEGITDDENEQTAWVEYRLNSDSELVHRSVHVTLKKPVLLFSEVAKF